MYEYTCIYLSIYLFTYIYVYTYIHVSISMSSYTWCISICSADGSTHTESNKLYRKVNHRSRPKSLLTPTAKARPVRRRSRRLQGRRAPHTELGLGEKSLSMCGTSLCVACMHIPRPVDGLRVNPRCALFLFFFIIMLTLSFYSDMG